MKSALTVHTYQDLLIKLPSLVKTTLNHAMVSLNDISLIAVSLGPGSFTSTRIGVSYAKALAYSLNKPIIGISTLKSIAASVPAPVGALVVPMYPSRPTRRYEAYTATFKRSGDELELIQPERAVEMSTLVDELRGASSPVVVCGIIRSEWNELLRAVLEAGNAAPILMPTMPSAIAIAHLAFQRWQRTGKGDDVFQIKPLYVLPSQAEVHFGIYVT